jgi:hypothetical protein
LAVTHEQFLNEIVTTMRPKPQTNLERPFTHSFFAELDKHNSAGALPMESHAGERIVAATAQG